VLLEIGIVERKEPLCKDVLVMAALIPVLAIPYRLSDPTYALFHSEFTRTLAAPLFLSVWSACGFFAYAWFRGVRQAEGGIVAMLLLGCLIGPETTTLGKLTPPQFLPLAILTGMQFGIALKRKSSLHCFGGVLGSAGLLALGLTQPDAVHWLRTVPLHLILLGAIVIGQCFRDRTARFLNRSGAMLLPPLSFATALYWQSAGIPEMSLLVYLLAMTVLPLGVWYFTRDRWYFASGIANVAAGSGGFSWMSYRFLKYEVGANIIEPLLYGAAFFLIAILISAHKAGAFRGMFAKKGDAPSNGPEIVVRE
ncbi:MAG TPA: hypothetical protein VLA12_01660, partial [Planctomycetaceae bacterium]|nr:hypothetical protein [Planctomycetaceae bacterium]